MNKEQVKGSLKEAAGEAQEQMGKAVGNRDQEAKGHAREFEGKTEKKVGDVKQAADDLTRKP